jgi:2-methylcitrate dehydratase PrpD
MDKLQMAMYLASVRLFVMEQVPADPEDRHWIADDRCTETILRYYVKAYKAEAVAHAIIDAYHAVEKELSFQSIEGK